MHSLGPPLIDPQARLTLDHLLDGVKTESLLLWQVLDTHTGRPEWVLGRRISETDVLPVALLLLDSGEVVKRYAPAKGGGGWDMSQIEKPNVNS